MLKTLPDGWKSFDPPSNQVDYDYWMGDPEDCCDGPCGLHIDDLPGIACAAPQDAVSEGEWTSATLSLCEYCGGWFCDQCWPEHLQREHGAPSEVQ